MIRDRETVIDSGQGSERHVLPHRDENLSKSEIAAVQQQAWLQTFRHVVKSSPFYRRHFQSAGFSEEDRPSLDALRGLPPVTKRELSEYAEEFLCVPRHQIAEVVTTSGSTGKPLLYPMTAGDLDRLALNEFLSFRCAGLDHRDTVILAVTLDRCFIAGMAYYLGLRRLGCTVIRVGPGTPQMHLEMIKRTNASAVVGVPSFLKLLAERARQSGIQLDALGVRKLICIGEPVRHENFTLNRVGLNLESAWGARVFSTYGVTELAASLCECEVGLGGHLHPSLLYLEALDESGQPALNGQVGELTATTFGVEALPLVRYRTGDFAAIQGGQCACGRQTLRVGPIVGRGNDKLKLKGVTLFPSTLKTALDAVAEVRSYVILARQGDDLSDDVEVQIACHGAADQVTEQLREHFQGVAKVVPRIQVAPPDVIEKLQMPEGCRKRRYFVDLRNES